MKKIILGILIVGFVIAITGVVIAHGPVVRQPAEVAPSGQVVEVPEQAIDSSPVLVRVIVSTTSPWLKSAYKLVGCQVVHELNDATALKCLSKVASLLNLREDRIFYITDLEADVQIHADDVWAQGIDGTGVNVAVLDTGIDTDHPELGDSIVGCQTFVEGTATCEDDHGHGTHVSGIITANGVDSMAKGVAPGAGIYMYKVCDASGSCYESDIMAAMEAAVLTDAKVMNISLGGGNFSGENCDTDTLAAKTNWVASNGITVAAAAGNDQFFVSSPGCASGAIAVGAVDKNGLMAYFSNFGPSLNIVAPGVDIYSSIIKGYASWSGTSMSAPHVAGTVALVLDANSNLTVDEIKTALYETADPINPDSVCYGVVRQRGAAVWIGEVECTSDNYGAGIVDAYGAANYYPLPVACTLDTECDDGLYCNGSEACVTGVCQAGTLIDCSALSDQCNEGVCNEAIDVCESQPKADGIACDDGLYCNVGEACLSGACTGGSALSCDDGESCTADSCDEALDTCLNTWPACSLTTDGCCGPDCTNETDIDCPAEDPCLNCFKGVCDGRCHQIKEDATCPDCW